MSSDVSTKQAVSGAFGGEMKYLFILLIAAAGVLFGSYYISFQLMGFTLQAANIGLMVGLIGAGVTFFLGWFLTYLAFWTKSSTKHSYKLIIRPENFEFVALVTPKNETFEELDKDGRPTGWRNKHFLLMEPTEFNPKYEQFGYIQEFIIHYFGNWKDLSELQPGNTEYKDMEMPNNSTEILTVKPVELAHLNVKHGVKVPVFQLIGGRFEERYFDPILTIPNPNTHQIGTVSRGQTIDSSAELYILREENRKLKVATTEYKRQGLEDKTNAIANQGIHDLDYAEHEGTNELLGKFSERVTAKVQKVVAAMDDWHDALKFLQGSRWSSIWPWIALIIGIIATFVFLSLNPQVTAQLAEVTQNWLVDLAIIATAGAIVAIAYIFFRRRRKR